MTVSEALLGCEVNVNTVSGIHKLEIQRISGSGHQHILHGKGVNGQGDHIAEFEIVMP